MQFRQGSVNVTNGSATVVVNGVTTGATGVAIGQAFKIDRDGDAIYLVASRTPSSGGSLTGLTLSAPYGGANATAIAFQITQDYSPRGYPLPRQGDADAADWIAHAILKIDADIEAGGGGIGGAGFVETGILYKGAAAVEVDTTTFTFTKALQKFKVGKTGAYARVHVQGDSGTTNADVGEIGFIRSTDNPTENAAAIVFHRGTTLRDGGLKLKTQNAAASLTTRLQVTPAGALLFGSHGIDSGAGAGEPVIPLASAVRSVDVAGTGTRKMVDFGVGGVSALRVAPDGDIVRLGSGTVADANAGDTVMTNAKHLRGANAANTGTKHLVGLNASDHMVISGDGVDVQWGVPPATEGAEAQAILGNTGGTGPTNSAMKEWHRVRNASGKLRFIATWSGEADGS